MNCFAALMFVSIVVWQAFQVAADVCPKEEQPPGFWEIVALWKEANDATRVGILVALLVLHLQRRFYIAFLGAVLVAALGAAGAACGSCSWEWALDILNAIVRWALQHPASPGPP